MPGREFIFGDHSAFSKQGLVQAIDGCIESANDLDIEEIAEKPIRQLKNGRDHRVVGRIFSSDYHLLCIFDDQDGVLVVKKEGDKRRFEEVLHKIILDENEILLLKLGNQMLDVAGFAGPGVAVKKNDAASFGSWIEK